ncbi:MAG: cation transporter [Candidatus Omnitrophica bacterium]|nr:cation transporter [Candidatus Omnitrophota bacterium]
MSIKSQRVLAIAFALTLAFCVFEFVGGKISGSLSLTADAAHMLSDASALGLAFFACIVASKTASSKMSYGYYRVEVLSAMINGVVLVIIAFYIVREAFERFSAPSDVDTTPMLVVASVGLIFNIIIGLTLNKTAEHNMNIRAALYHTISDALASAAVVIGGVLIAWTGWTIIDPILSVAIACIIVFGAFHLLKDVCWVLLEAAPDSLDCDDLRAKILRVNGVLSMHDLHVWSISPGKEALSAHVEINENASHEEILTRVNELLWTKYKIDHTTLQLETPSQRKLEQKKFHE